MIPLRENDRLPAVIFTTLISITSGIVTIRLRIVAVGRPDRQRRGCIGTAVSPVRHTQPYLYLKTVYIFASTNASSCPPLLIKETKVVKGMAEQVDTVSPSVAE